MSNRSRPVGPWPGTTRKLAGGLRRTATGWAELRLLQKRDTKTTTLASNARRVWNITDCLLFPQRIVQTSACDCKRAAKTPRGTGKSGFRLPASASEGPSLGRRRANERTSDNRWRALGDRSCRPPLPRRVTGPPARDDRWTSDNVNGHSAAPAPAEGWDRPRGATARPSARWVGGHRTGSRNRLDRFGLVASSGPSPTSPADALRWPQGGPTPPGRSGRRLRGLVGHGRRFWAVGGHAGGRPTRAWTQRGAGRRLGDGRL